MISTFHGIVSNHFATRSNIFYHSISYAITFVLVCHWLQDRSGLYASRQLSHEEVPWGV